jgi:hypothetical protein
LGGQYQEELISGKHPQLLLICSATHADADLLGEKREGSPYLMLFFAAV